MLTSHNSGMTVANATTTAATNAPATAGTNAPATNAAGQRQTYQQQMRRANDKRGGLMTNAAGLRQTRRVHDEHGRLTVNTVG